MNLRQLKYFVGVVEAGNMAPAAEQLHVAQTAVGQQLQLSPFASHRRPGSERHDRFGYFQGQGE